MAARQFLDHEDSQAILDYILHRQPLRNGWRIL